MKLWTAIAAAVVACGAGVAWAVNTGGMDYWDGDVPVEYIYSTYTVSGPVVDTGSMEYSEGDSFARYIYQTTAAENYSEWLSAYPGTETPPSPTADSDGDGWSNGAEYGYWEMTGEESDPINGASGGQAIELEQGWNLVGLAADACWYVGAGPGSGERALIPATYPDGYESVASIGTLLATMGIGDKVERISGWHPLAGGGAKEPVTWAGIPQLDSLKYLAGGYGYWVKVTSACTWKMAGKARLKGVGESKEVALAPGWNDMADLYTKVHYEGTSPAVGFGSDETGRASTGNICNWLRNQVKDGVVGAPDGVEAMVTYDEKFPYVRTYYSGIPGFLQTLKYAGPGMGMLVKVTGLTAPAVVYPVE